MKKLLSLIIVAAMALSAALSLVPASGAVVYGFISGDVNDDRDVNMKDILLMRRFVAGLEELRKINFKSSDVNADDDVNMKDILKLRRSVAGLEPLDGTNTDGRYKVDSVSIGDRNITRFTILLPENADPCVEYSAKVFRDRINGACGYKLNITKDPSAVKDGKIEFVHDTEGANDLEYDGFRIVTSGDGSLTIYCGKPNRQRGSLYSVYHILEEFIGYRFLIADDYGSEDGYDEENGDIVYLYESENAAIPAGYDESIVPQITYRALSQRGRSSTNFAALHLNDIPQHEAKYGWRVGTLYTHAHSYAYQMAGIEHAYDNDEYINAHKLHDTQPCLTSEETYEKIIEYLVWLVEDRKTWGTTLADGTRVGNDRLFETYTQVSCSPNDNVNFCKCANCTAVYAEEGSISGTVFRLANRVAEYMDNLYPGIEIYTIAYWDARRPPKLTRPLDNICVCYCIGGCNNHTYDNTDECLLTGGNPRLQQKNWDGTGNNSSNYDDINYYLGWTELTNNIQIWYYSCNYTYYLAPAPNIFNIYNDIKYLASTGTTGVYFEGSSSAKYCFELLRGYLATKMMWDPLMSEEEFNDLIDEFLMICYGDGWRYIRQYLEMANYSGDLRGCWTNNFDRPWEMNDEEYFKEHYKEMAVLFDNAYAAAKTQDQRNRVLNCRMQCDFLGLSATYDRDWKNGNAESRAEFKARYDHLYSYVVDNNVYVAGLVPRNSDSTGCENFPRGTAAETPMKPMEWLWQGCTGYWD